LARDPQVDNLMRANAVISLGRVGRADEEVLDSLLTLVQDTQEDQLVRFTAYESLKQLVGTAVD